MEMPWKNFNCSSSFSFAEVTPTKEDLWIQRRRDSACNYTEQPESKRLRRIGQNSLPSALRTSEFMSGSKVSSCLSEQNQSSSTITTTCQLPTSALPLFCDPVDEPRPLGLSLRKSQSLVDLIQQNLNQNDQSSLPEQSLEDNIKIKEIEAAESQHDKLKASNFPACYVKIGKWECSSIYEGDLVAKCYYAKRKLVWEVLDNGLKSKIEIQWSDITGLKAIIPEKGPACLHVEISRTPLFFRETNPQPRKHTLWQSTSDFTGGQASFCRRHFLQFSEGILNRHFDKLIQCDPHLKNLSEQSMPFSGSPFFEGRILMLDMQTHHQYLYPGNISSSVTLGSLENEMLMSFNHAPGPIVKQNSIHLIEQSDDRASMVVQPFSPSSVMDSRANDESSNSDTEELYAKDFRRRDGCKKRGISMLFDQRILYGDRSISSTIPHPTVGTTSMVSCSNLPQCKVPGGLVPLPENNATLSEQNFLQRLSNHLFEDTVPETFLPNMQTKEFSSKFIPDAEEKVQQKSLLSGSLTECNRMIDIPIHGHSGPSYTLEMAESLGFRYPVKEEHKSREGSFRPVKLEDCVSSLLNGTMFSPSGNYVLSEGQPGMSRNNFFGDPLDSPQVPHLFCTRP